jgi:hypothetical protein
MPRYSRTKKKLKQSQAPNAKVDGFNLTQAQHLPEKAKGQSKSKLKTIDSMSMNEFDSVLNMAIAETKAKEKVAQKKAPNTGRANDQKMKNTQIHTPLSTSPSKKHEDDTSDHSITRSESTIHVMQPDLVGPHTWVHHVIDYGRRFDFVVQIKKLMMQANDDFPIIFPEDEHAPAEYRNLYLAPNPAVYDDSDEEFDDDLPDQRRRIYRRPLLDYERIQELSESENRKENKTIATNKGEGEP